MKPEELKNIEYDFEDDVCIIYINGKMSWKINRNELKGKEGFKVGTLRISVEKGDFI